eukprot:Seg13155.3 transcript_id=Seg13155.3/GoldUCD/mRNA.D3Y31 product="Mu-like prophage FluMu protein gp28" protein_id=Seg13155.3/GoldUCD/D3Y31
MNYAKEEKEATLRLKARQSTRTPVVRVEGQIACQREIRGFAHLAACGLWCLVIAQLAIQILQASLCASAEGTPSALSDESGDPYRRIGQDRLDYCEHRKDEADDVRAVRGWCESEDDRWAVQVAPERSADRTRRCEAGARREATQARRAQDQASRGEGAESGRGGGYSEGTQERWWRSHRRDTEGNRKSLAAESMSKRIPDHARNFRGKAKNIPAEPIIWLPYQESWQNDSAIMKLMQKTRRAGVSYGDSYESARYHSKRSSKQDTWVSSRDETTAKLYAKDTHGFAKKLDQSAGILGQDVLLDSNGKRVLAHTVPFANGTALHSVASNPDVFAGKGGRVKLDEFALRRDPRGVYAIASPTIDWGGSLSIISTHRGSANYFNTLIRQINEDGNPKGFSLHTVTLENALDQHLLWKMQCLFPDGDPRLEMDEQEYFDYQRNRAADEETFQQEYMCVAADDADAFITYAMLDACTYRQGERWEFDLEDAAECSNKLYGGIDIGRTNDLTSFVLLEGVNGQYFMRKRIDLQKMPFSAQERVLYPWVKHCDRVCVDNTGLGMQFTERLQEKYGRYKVEAVTFTNKVKEAMAYPVRTAFEDKAIRIPFADEKLTSDLRAIRKETTAAGNIRFSADRSEDGHADRFWGLALAIEASSKKGGKYSGTLIE